ncbi:PssD/Cps14F family polysaccharide biosynthesis glycosyltransferase [Methanobacterium sp.]|uniref:PssD/Cps14F family polysaccharide biosynthesis glycosyltransferase n=1 Tax=Methanobacterium sp. TaxID=2164 RepID=UPI003C73783C
MKIALICSHGGHLTEMLYLMDAFKGHDVFFATYDNIRTRNLPYKTYLFPNFGASPLKLFRYLPKIINIFLKEKPDLIVSNGAEIAIPFFYIAKLFRIKTVFIECYTRIDMPTITGKLVFPVSNLFLVLWPEMLTKYGNKAKYWGGIFNLENSSISKNNGNHILVITGMHSGFERLVKKMDEIAGKIDEKVIIQTGNTDYEPKYVEHFKFKDYEEIKELIKGAKVTICPGAMTILDSLVVGTPVITVPRLEQYGEHLNDHQLTFAKKLEEIGYVKIIEDVNQLETTILDNDISSKKIMVNTSLISKLSNIIKKRN